MSLPPALATDELSQCQASLGLMVHVGNRHPNSQPREAPGGLSKATEAEPRPGYQ